MCLYFPCTRKNVCSFHCETGVSCLGIHPSAPHECGSMNGISLFLFRTEISENSDVDFNGRDDIT